MCSVRGCNTANYVWSNLLQILPSNIAPNKQFHMLRLWQRITSDIVYRPIIDIEACSKLFCDCVTNPCDHTFFN